MPFRLLSENKQVRLSGANLAIPLVTFVVGIAITLILAHTFHKVEKKSRHDQLSSDVRELSKNLDLVLLNSVLRLQSFQEIMDPIRPEQLSRHYLLKEVLKNTVFQRGSTFRMDTRMPPDGLPNLRLLFRTRLDIDQMPNPTSAYMQSPFVRRKISKMLGTGRYSTFAINQLDNVHTLSLIWRSPFNKREFIVFTTPLEAVLSDWPARSELRTLISDVETGVAVLVGWNQSGQPTITSDAQMIQDFKQKHQNPLASHQLTSLDSGIQVDWHSSEPNRISQFTLIILLNGFLVVGLLSLLLRFILDQNRKIANLVVSRTEDLQMAMSEAQEANLAKTRFLANMSHELRTPLNLILGMLELLENKVSDPKIVEFVRSMQAAGDHLLNLITDLLSMSREESTEVDLKSIPLNTPVFFEEIGRIIGPDCRRKNLSFGIYLSPEIPQVMRGDPGRVRQVILNLLRNSLKYTQNGFVHLDVSVLKSHPEKSNISIRFEVSDSGIGIPKGKVEKIFDRFFQLEGSKRLAEGGVGLGLSIVKDLVSKMNGEIFVISEVGVGSTFTVDIDFEVVQAASWQTTYFHPQSEHLKVAVVSSHKSRQRQITTLIPSHLAEVAVVSPADFAQRFKKDTHIDKWVVDVSPAVDLSVIRTDEDAKKIILAGREEVFKEAGALKKATFIEDCPILPTQLLLALNLHTKKRGASGAKAKSEEKSQAFTFIDTRPRSILIADDDSGNRELLRAYFDGQPWTLIFTTNGQEALQEFVHKQPDLVIADLRMPIMDGFELTDELRSHEKREGLVATPVILVTADALEETSQEANKHGVSILLTKPIRKTKLLATIDKLLQ